MRAQAGPNSRRTCTTRTKKPTCSRATSSFDDLILNAGDYHLARPGVRHPVGRTRAGCTLLVTTAA